MRTKTMTTLPIINHDPCNEATDSPTAPVRVAKTKIDASDLSPAVRTPPVSGRVSPPHAGYIAPNGDKRAMTAVAPSTDLGKQSGDTAGRRSQPIVRNKPSSPSLAISTNTVENKESYPSPVPAGKRSALVGFDPFMSSNSLTEPTSGVSASTAPASAPTQQSKRFPRPSVAGTQEISPLPFAAPKGSSKISTKKKPHHRGVQTFCMSDLLSISQNALVQEGLWVPPDAPEQKRSNPSSRGASPSPPDGNRTSSPSQNVHVKAAQPKSLGPTRLSSKDSASGKTTKKANSTMPPSPPTREEQQQRSSLTPTRKKLPWSKKGHRRTKSLECREPIVSPSMSKKKNGTRSSVPNTPLDSSQKVSMYPGIVGDLMQLDFDKIQLPSLAKPSPTSFLTGKEEEVARTCELDAAPFQVEIPTLRGVLLAARLNEFVSNYRRVDQNFDLQQWVGYNRMDLMQVKMKEHIPIAQSLLDSGEEICVRGVVSKGTNADDRVEAAVFEGQHEFVVVLRGTTEHQLKPVNSKSKKKAVPLDMGNEKVEVYQCFLDEYMKIESDCFALLDKLTEEQPFCDVLFTGHSFAAAMATLAAYRYANARQTMRVSCLAFGSPKVGFSFFRQVVHSLPNLKMVRIEYSQDGKCQLPSVGGSHVGHTLALHGSLGHNSVKTKQPVLAYKFETPKHKIFKTTYPDLASYVTALEEVSRLNLSWAKEFVGTSGEGVVVNHEARRMV